MTGIISIKLFGDLNFDSEEERILEFLEKQKYKFEFLSFGEE